MSEADTDEKPAAAPDVSLPSITARLLAIAALGEEGKTGPMLSLARAALMDAARLNGLTDAEARGAKSQPTLEDLIEQLDRDDGAADQP